MWTGLLLHVPVGVKSEASHLSTHCCQQISHWLTLLRQTWSRNVDKQQLEVNLHGELK